MVKSLLILASFMAMHFAYSLEIDEKLSLRFLKVSNTKKTVLINRGAEDGLAVGDHAKFFITSGVLARGVVEKVSPSRSIWSLYRIVDPAEITDGKVLNLKIATPVKITEDPTKSTKDEGASAGTDKMSIKDGDTIDDTTVLNDSEKSELEGMGIEETETPPVKVVTTKKEKKKKKIAAEVIEESIPVMSGATSKNWEVFGMLYVNALTGTISNPNTLNGSTGASASSIDFSAGIERYFHYSDSFLRNMSLEIFAHKRSVESDFLTTTGIKTSADWLEFGGGASYHFYNSAASVGRLIGFANVTGGAGTATSKETTTDIAGLETSLTTKGTDKFFTLGIGAKYNLSNGLGVRSTFDYYHASESYTLTGTTTNSIITRTLAGPRIQFGISYRF